MASADDVCRTIFKKAPSGNSEQHVGSPALQNRIIPTIYHYFAKMFKSFLIQMHADSTYNAFCDVECIGTSVLRTG
jgi:hypothetical protein